MRTLDLQSRRSGAQQVRIVLTCALALTFALILQACGGNSSYVTPTLGNPAPGVQLVAISISPSTSLIGLAENRQLFANATYSDGSTGVLTSGVTWATSPASTSAAPGNVSVTSAGMATGLGIGSATITATVGSVVGAISLIVDTNGFTTNTTAILSVPYKSTIVDAAYLAQNQTKIRGAYAVQEVNLDADQFSSVLPVPLALLSSVPLPSGFTPDFTVGVQSSFLVAVFSYSSPSVQIIDASNNSDDVASNTVINAFTAPVTQSVTINGITCMICAAVLNPANNQIILSTAQGFYSMDPVAGTFTAIAFTPSPAPAQNFSLNPVAPCASNPANLCPYILAPNPATGEIQVLDLTTDAVTSFDPLLGGAAGAVAVDVVADNAAAVQAATPAVETADINNQSLINLFAIQSPGVSPVTGISSCTGSAPQDMVAMGIGQSAVAVNASHTMFTSQTLSASPAAGSCLGFETAWPALPSSTPISGVNYYYGLMPATPDLLPFLNGDDPNAITTFNSIYDKKNYGLLVDQNQAWLAKIVFGVAVGTETPVFLPVGAPFQPPYLCAAGQPGCPPPQPIIYLPVPSTDVTLSVQNLSFGTVADGTLSAPLPVTLGNVGLAILDNQISISGPNASDFTLTDNCAIQLQPRTSCVIDVTFTPSAASGTVESATLVITAAAPQTVALSGTAQ
jgi:hypothetical protein